MLGQQVRKSSTAKTWRERNAMDQKKRLQILKVRSTNEDILGSTETALVL